MEVVELYAQNECRITGAIAADGSVRKFVYSYDQVNLVRLYVLEDGTELPDTPVKLISSDGRQWDSTEVEWYTLMKRKS